MAFALLGTHPGMLAAQSSCPRDAPFNASFSSSCAGMRCTFTNTSPQQPSGFASLEWDFGDGNFTQGPAASTSPISYTYAAGGFYPVTLTVTLGDGQVAVATGGVSLGGPAVPLASDDAFSTPENTPLTIGIAELLSNDLPGVTFYQVTRCVVSPDGSSCVYVPPNNFVGVDTFTYWVRDSLGNQGSATVTITVTQPLIANPDNFTTYIGVPVQITSTQLLANDVPSTAVFVRAENPVNGTLTFVGVTGQGATYQFTPAGQSVGSGSFDYLISLDGNPPYEMGFAYITVIDKPPTAAFSVQCTNRNCTVHTTSTDDTSITKYVWDWGDGTVVQPPPPNPWLDQTHTYAHSGRYTITLTVTDTAGLTNATAQAVLANTPPAAGNVTATTERDLAVTIDVLANASDADGDPLMAGADLSAYPGASYQAVQLANGRWAIKVTPPDSFVGTMTFPYVAQDPWGATATATVTLTVTQWSVVIDALGQEFACIQNGSVRIPLATLLAIDYDSAGATLTIVAFDTSVLMGTLDCTTDPTACTYRPPMNAYGYTFFRYTVSDPVGRKDTATVKIYVGNSPYGSAPRAVDDFFTTTMNTPRAFTIQDITQNAINPDGDTLAVGLQSEATAYGSLTCSVPMYTCTYTPNPGYVGSDRFAYTATDELNPASTAYINVLTLPNPTPTFDAREDVIVTGVNQPISFGSGLLSNDYEPSGYPITVTGLNTTGLIGSLTCSSTGCTYVPPNSFQGTTTFKYTATNGHGATDTAIVKICVGCINHPPVATPQTLSTPKNTALRFSVFQLMQNDYDPDDDPLTVTVFGFAARLGTLSCNNPSYWCVYTPNANATGADVLSYSLSDGTTSVTSSFTINITP